MHAEPEHDQPAALTDGSKVAFAGTVSLSSTEAACWLPTFETVNP